MKENISISIIFSTLLLITKSAPTERANQETSEQTTEITKIIPESVAKEVNIVSYIQNFKNAMTEYILSEYKDLSEHEIEEVKNILEEFLANFAGDLMKSVEKQKKRDENVKEDTKDTEEAKTEDIPTAINEDDELKKLNEETEKLASIDGSSNVMFDDVKKKLRSEFPEINEFTAKEIVYHLRKNLYETRQKLDKVINYSKRSKAEFAEDTRIEHDVSTTPVKDLEITGA